MAITVKFFASLRESIGRDSIELPFETGLDATAVWARATGDVPLPAHVLVAINMEYAQPGQQVADGDEVAFFPPVTGGAG